MRNAKYIPITTDDLRVNTILDFDIFIQTNNNVVLFRKKNLPFTEEALRNLAEHKVRTIFISENDKGKFKEYCLSSQNSGNSGMSMKGCAPPFDNPENIEKYYNSHLNYYPIEKTNLLPGSKVDFNVYKKLDIDVELWFGPQNENDLSDIAPENIHRIFDPFFSTKKETGVGLGLFVCKGLIENHAGEILLETKPGKGSAFIIKLKGEPWFPRMIKSISEDDISHLGIRV